MRTACLCSWVLCLNCFLVSARANESALRLTGIIGLPDFKCALVESPGPPRGEGFITLAEGQRKGTIEVLTISHQTGLVEISEAGRKVTLQLERPAATLEENARSNLRLSKANLQQVLDVYARLKERTVLQHPAIKAAVLSLDASTKDRTEAAAALEKLLEEQGLVSIPDGTKFVIIIPSQLTNTAYAKPSGIVPKTTDTARIPTGSIHFDSADLSQALAIYARLVDRKLVKPEGLPTALIRLRTVNEVTTAEAAYALETLFRWNGVKVVPIGETEFQALPIR